MTIHALIGHSASGKTTVAKILEMVGVERIVTITTRPPREEEADGVDYHFIKVEEFLELYRGGHLVESNAYRGWHYGTSLKDVEHVVKDYVVVLDPNGYRALKEKLGEFHVVGYFLNSSERDRLIRLAKRGDDVDEIIRRLLADRELFAGIEDEVDHVIKSDDIDETADDVLELIRGVQ